MRIGFFGEHRNKLGESPLWDAASERLWWIDARAVAPEDGLIYSAGADGVVLTQWRYDRPLGSIGLAQDGLLAAMTDGFYRIDQGGREQPIWRTAAAGPVRFNDGKMDRAGQFLSGQMETVEQADPAARLWRLDREGEAAPLAAALHLANAICFSPQGDVLYFADSPQRMIWAHEYDPRSAELGPRIATIDCRPLGSIPDGATVDEAGNLWVALVLAQVVACFAPDGRLLRRIELPLPFPSCPAFGGKDLATLFVTTIKDSGRYLKSDHPDAGRILAIDGLGTAGLPEARWTPARSSR